MTYTKEKIEKKVKNRKKQLYQERCVNYRGETADTGELFTEVISELLLSDIKLLTKDIVPVTRGRSYKVKTHKWQEYEPTATREEEVFARSLYNKQLGELRILDYQVPLKDYIAGKHPGLGKIDLLAWDGEHLIILELKKPDSDETLLRCLLEAYSYAKTVNTEKLADDFDYDSNTKVRAAVFVFEGSKPHEDWMSNNQPKVKKLMKELGVGLYTLKNLDDTMMIRLFP